MNVLTDNKVKMMKPHYRVTQYLHSLDFWSKFETFYFPKGFEKKKKRKFACCSVKLVNKIHLYKESNI